jgi:hypothetical protein
MTAPFRPLGRTLRFAEPSAAPRRFGFDAPRRSMMMANIQVVKVEEQLNRRVL